MSNDTPVRSEDFDFNDFVDNYSLQADDYLTRSNNEKNTPFHSADAQTEAPVFRSQIQEEKQ